jgi:hypothetical protein
MRLYTQMVRLSILAALVLAAVACGGWKWDAVPH